MNTNFRISLLFGAVAMLLSAVTMTSCDDDNDGPVDEGKLKYEVVDLGLPSKTKWAAYNVGATTPEGYGLLVSWGEIKEKAVYSWDTYLNLGDLGLEDFVGTDDDPMKDYAAGKSISGTKWDVATQLWGNQYVMPTRAQLEELIDERYTTQEETEINGIKGVKITSKTNSKSIFLPSAGYGDEDGQKGVSIYGCYWGSEVLLDNANLVWSIEFIIGRSLPWVRHEGRSDGQSVRAVLKQ